MELKPGYEQTEVGVIPEDWKLLPFDSLGTVIDGDRGVNYPSEQEFRDSGYCLFLNAGNVTKDGFRFNECAFITREKNAQLHKGKLKREDIVLTTRGTVGNFAYFDSSVPFNNLRINSGMVILRNESLALLPEFLYALLQSHLVQMQIERLSFGSAQPQLTVKGIKKFRITVPPLPEQRSIAEALTHVDALLGGLDRLIAKKRDLKQAAMQQLLTGQIRLPGFHGEWEVKRLGDVIYLIPSGIYGEEKPRLGLIPSFVVTTTHIEENDTWNQKEMPVRFFTPEKLQNYATITGDLIVVKSSGSAAKIQSGKIGFIDHERAGTFLFSNFLMLLRPTGIMPTFLYFYLCSHNVKKLLPTLVEASTYPNIRLGDYLDVEIPVPSPAEQTAIAEVLMDIDAELAVLEQRREKTRDLKQAMMQELLTGRTRLL